MNLFLWGSGSLLATKAKRYFLVIALHLFLYMLLSFSPVDALWLALVIMLPGSVFFTIEGLRPIARRNLLMRLTAQEHDRCVNCGVKLEKPVKFCPECGHSQT